MASYGLNVEFNSKDYVVYLRGRNENRDYHIGEMACEMANADLDKLKRIVRSNAFFDAPFIQENAQEALEILQKTILEEFPPVISNLVLTEFYIAVPAYFGLALDEKINMLKQYEDILNRNHALIGGLLEEMEVDRYGNDTVGRFLMIVLATIIIECASFSYTLEAFTKPNANEHEQDVINYLTNQFWGKLDALAIKYSIIKNNGRLNSVYTIENITALLFFELANILNNGIKITKCKNCGRFFIPTKRSDTLYCRFPSPSDPDKTCKEIGAQLAWNRKQQTDSVTNAYRRVYMRYKMKCNRHPDDTEAQKQLEEIILSKKEWTKKIEAAEATPEEYIQWLDTLA